MGTGNPGQFSDILLIFGIQRADCQHHDAEHNTQRCDPDLGLFPLGHVQNPALGVAFPKGYPGQNLPPGGQPQQGGGVVCPVVWLQLPDHCLVTAHFHVLLRQQEGTPHQGIEPVDAQRRVGQQLPHRVAPADVAALMGQDVVPFPVGHGEGNVDFREKHPKHKGSADVVGEKRVAPVGNGPHQLPAQPKIAHAAVQCQAAHSRKPDPGRHGHGREGSFLGRFLRRGVFLGRKFR